MSSRFVYLRLPSEPPLYIGRGDKAYRPIENATNGDLDVIDISCRCNCISIRRSIESRRTICRLDYIPITDSRVPISNDRRSAAHFCGRGNAVSIRPAPTTLHRESRYHRFEYSAAAAKLDHKTRCRQLLFWLYSLLQKYHKTTLYWFQLI